MSARLSINVGDEAHAALFALRARTGMNHTYNVNSALVSFDYLTRQLEEGAEIIVRKGDVEWNVAFGPEDQPQPKKRKKIRR